MTKCAYRIASERILLPYLSVVSGMPCGGYSALRAMIAQARSQPPPVPNMFGALIDAQ